MSTLFPDRAELQQPGHGHSPLLASFKAGLLTHEARGDGSYQVTADPRRGRCRIQRNDDGTRSFLWGPRDTADTQGAVELVLAPGEQVFKRVDTGVSTDRVYLLQSTVVDSRRFFFWLQETDASKDHEIVNNVNGLLGANVAPAVDGSALSELDSVLAALGVDPSDFGTNEPAPQQQREPVMQRPVAVPFGALLSHDKVREAVERPEVQAELLPLLPEGMQTVEELRATLATPQFQMALRRLSAACMSGQYNDIMGNFQLNPADGAAHLMQGNGIAAVVAALIAKAQREGKGQSSNAAAASEDGAGGSASGSSSGGDGGDAPSTNQ